MWRPCGVKGAPGRDSEKCMGWGRVCPCGGKDRGGISRFEYNRGEIHAEIVRGKLDGSSVQ